MPKRVEQLAGERSDVEVVPFSENVPDHVAELKNEARPENPEEIEREIERLKQSIIEAGEEKLPVKDEILEPKVREQRIKEYQDRYLPSHLRKKGMGVISKILTYMSTKGERFDKEGEENIPEKGPFIVISNHWGGASGVDESMTLLRTFKEHDLHLTAGKEIWWNRSPILKWLFKQMGTIPVEESLSNLTDAEKEEALLRQGEEAQPIYRKIIDREKEGKLPTNAEFVRQAVALLSRGDALGIYPEGLWLDPQGSRRLREKSELKKGYAGIELVARQYEKLTGEELPILPTANIEDLETGKRKVIIGKPLLLSKNESGQSDTDWCMAHIAEMLPVEQRGYYKEIDLEK